MSQILFARQNLESELSAKASLCCVYLGLTQKGTRVIYCYFIGYKLLYFHNFDFLWQPCFISHQTIYFLPDTSDVQQKKLEKFDSQNLQQDVQEIANHF